MQMSSQLAYVIGRNILENYLTLAAQALCCYDYCLTFSREVQFMWSSKMSAGSLLFYTLRYPALVNTVAIILGYLSWGSWQTQMSCVLIVRIQMVGDILILTSSTVFTVLRIYALSRSSKWICVFTLILGMINPIMSTYTFIVSTPYLGRLTPTYQSCFINTPFRGDICRSCDAMRTLRPLILRALVALVCARLSAVLFDAVALFLTWLGLRRATRPVRDDTSSMGTMTVVLMRDTAIYFGFLFVINALGIGVGLSDPKFLDALSTWSAVVTSVLLCRLMLDLRQANSEDVRGGTYISRALTSMMSFDTPSDWDHGSADEMELLAFDNGDGPVVDGF